jgi:hypothetical protein
MPQLQISGLPFLYYLLLVVVNIDCNLQEDFVVD